MSTPWNEKADLAADAYIDRAKNESVVIHGTRYVVLDSVSSSATGFQATAYLDIDQGKVEIMYRGTEALGDRLRDDKVDYEMVRSRLNAQLPEAEAFTRKVLAEAKELESRYHHRVEVTVGGHSLGGTLAEVMGYRHRLGGEAFNSYGSVDLAYGLAEGQPRNAPLFINHVKATDIVSAASHHYGTVRVYATEQDVADLKAGRYLDAPNPRHPANPMIAGQLSAHFISNFAPEPGKGESILTPANEARYEQYHAAFDHFRHDVLTSRVALHDLLNDKNRDANKAHLTGQLDDVVDVTRYKLAVRGLEYVTGLDVAKERMQGIGNVTQALGSVARANIEATAASVHATGEAVDGAAHTASHVLHEGGQTWRQVGDTVSRNATQLRPAAPLVADAMGLGTRIVGAVGAMAADDIASKASTAGSLFHGASEWASKELHQAGNALHEGTAWASRQWHETGERLQHAVDGLASTQAHDAIGDTLRGLPRLDEPGHPDHRMYLQGWSKVQQLDAERGRASDQCSTNLSGALVPACKAQGMTRIDAVTLSDDGSRAFASEHLLGRTVQRYAVVDTAQAVHTPLEQSSAQAASMAAASASADMAAQARQQAAPPLQR